VGANSFLSDGRQVPDLLDGYPDLAVVELSRSYQVNLDRLPGSLKEAVSLLTRGEAQASALLFGPKQYVRTTGKPNVYKDTFLAKPGKGWLYILNGDEDGENRVSSAIITLNGKDIFKTRTSTRTSTA